MKAIALDLGGTRIKVGIVEGRSVRATTMLEAFSSSGLEARLPLIEEAVRELLQRAGIPSGDCAGIGIAMPGIIDTEAKRVLSVNEKYADAPSIDLKKWALDAFDLPVYLENDARSALMGEHRYGAGAGTGDIVMVTLGTGVGGAAMMGGRLLCGRHYQAGCLGGHFTINYLGHRCNCGNVGCVETEASTWSLPRLARSDPHFSTSLLAQAGTIDYETVFAMASRGDELSVKLVQRSLRAWSACVVNLIHAYDPELVILGGGIMQSADVILPFVKNYVEGLAWTPWGRVDIAPSLLNDNAALLGITALLEDSLR